ncbi:MAG: DUF4386 domain-containing protein, partial [Phaeodactylibacter sp.]|nr:DUF4386 domain-containing protein [Phaeodactylibacter sp.]
CLLLGWQIRRADVFPTIFGWLMLAAGCGYLLETFGDFLVPGHEGVLALVVGISAALGEVSLTFYMLIAGTKTSYSENLKPKIT